MVLKDHWINARKAVGDDGATVSRHQGIDAGTSAKLPVAVPLPLPRDYPAQLTKVRMAEEHNVYFATPPMTSEDIADRWYSPGELRTFRKKRTMQVQAMLREDRGCKNPENYQTVLWQAYEDCKEGGNFSPPFFQCMAKILYLHPSRVGLETVGVPMVSIRQNMQRKEMRRSIQSIQRLGSSSGMRCDKLAESIRLTSESFSRTSILYAGIVALAHAVGAES